MGESLHTGLNFHDYRKHFLDTPEAHALISALVNFIRPFTNLSRDNVADDNKDCFKASLNLDAQTLLTALGNLVMRTFDPQAVVVSAPQDPQPLSAPDVQIPSPSPSPKLPTKLSDTLRAHVFNNIPIRLFTFAPDGALPKLIERNTIYDHIARKISNAVNVSDISAKISKEFTCGLNIQGQPLYQSLEEAEKAVISSLVEEHSRYAILSHTWMQNSPGEMTFDDWKSRTDDDDIGQDKLSRFCKVAAQNHRVTLAWMDNICINKNSSSELDESIRSMYKWYSNAYICVTYLSETVTITDMRNDRWFTRGWTLQELLAPRQIKFYNKNWDSLTSDNNDKHNKIIRREIKSITTITSSELHRFHRNVHSVEISRKMQWAASREVTKEEDSAYSLLGIFGVSIPIAYGEGMQRAFLRLIEAILPSSQAVWDVFNCAGPSASTHIHRSSIIPSSPKDYLRRSAAFDGLLSNNNHTSTTLLEPITLTHLGVRMRVLFILAQDALAEERYIPYRRFSGTVVVKVFKDLAYTSQAYNLFPKSAFYGPIPDSREVTAFCVLNFSETTESVYIPSDCLAFGFQWAFDGGTNRLTPTGNRRRMITEDPIVFKLKDTNVKQQFHIAKKDLEAEGLQLFTLHL